MWGEVLEEVQLDVSWNVSLGAAGIYFQACSFNHSDISPSLESTTYERSDEDYDTRRSDSHLVSASRSTTTS